MKRKGCALYSLIALAIIFVGGNFFPPLSIMGCAVTPSRFRGQVMDQHGSPVPNAEIQFSRHLTIMSFTGERSSQVADENGCFSYYGIFGAGLVVTASKSGYYPLYGGNAPDRLRQSQKAYWGGYDDVSSPRKLEIFHLFKPSPAEDLVYGRERSFRMAKDGSPLVLSFDGKHQLEVRTWTSEAGKPDERAYTWRSELKVINGGMQSRNSEFAFEAPADGYAATTAIDMPAIVEGKPNSKWNSRFEQDFFFRFNDGCYGRAKIEIISGGDHFLIFEPYLNPKPGSRNLSVIPK